MSKDKKFGLTAIGAMIVLGVALAYQLWPRTPGTLRVLTPDTTLTISGPWLSEISISESEPQVVPSGQIRPLEAAVISGRGADAYRLRCTGPWGQLKNVHVQANQTTELRFGPPLTYKVNVQNQGSRTVGLTPLLVGSSGEHYQIGVTKGGRRLAAPGFRILDKDGQLLHKDKFGFG